MAYTHSLPTQASGWRLGTSQQHLLACLDISAAALAFEVLLQVWACHFPTVFPSQDFSADTNACSTHDRAMDTYLRLQVAHLLLPSSNIDTVG